MINLELIKKQPLEREGPLGTGDAQGIQVDRNGNVYFLGLWELRIFNPEMDSMTLVKLTPENLKGLEKDESVGSESLITSDGKYLLSTYYSNGRSNAGLLLLSLNDLSLKKYPFDLGDRLLPFEMKMYEKGSLKMTTIERIFLKEIEEKILISTGHFNETYILDIPKDTLFLKTHHSKLTPDEKKKPEKSSVESFEELEKILGETGKQVTFGSYIPDQDQKKIWRFSRVVESELEGKKVYKNVVTLFDFEMNQLGETSLPIFPFGPFFFKDGKLWSYVNVNDELGFAVMEFKLD